MPTAPQHMVLSANLIRIFIFPYPSSYENIAQVPYPAQITEKSHSRVLFYLTKSYYCLLIKCSKNTNPNLASHTFSQSKFLQAS